MQYSGIKAIILLILTILIGFCLIFLEIVGLTYATRGVQNPLVYGVIILVSLSSHLLPELPLG